MSKETKRTPVAKRIAAAVSAGVLAASMMGAPLALAADYDQTNNATATSGGPGNSESSVAAKTELKVLYKAEGEHTVTDENLAFTVPTVINYTADAAGNLTGPSGDAMKIGNESTFTMHVSGLEVTPKNEWNLKSGSEIDSLAETKTNTNLVSASITAQRADKASGETLDLAAFTAKKAPTTAAQWQMGFKGETETVGSEQKAIDALPLVTGGKVKNVTFDLSDTTNPKQKFAEVQWYFKAGNHDGNPSA